MAYFIELDRVTCPACGEEYPNAYEIQGWKGVSCYECGFEFGIDVRIRRSFTTKCKECRYKQSTIGNIQKTLQIDGKDLIYAVCIMCEEEKFVDKSKITVKGGDI